MDNIIEYVKEFGGYSFYERPFCEVDALILSQFSYFKWEFIIPGLSDNKEPISIQEMKERMYEGDVFSYAMYAEDNKKLWTELTRCKRFASMKCNYISEILSENMQTQFCAFTVLLDGVDPVIVFRGTDETILGWKEDYDMAKDSPIAGQRIAAMYLRQVALRLKGNLITAGHSKGGNLAIYSVMDNSEEIQDRVSAIYSFDGPHFRSDILERYNYNDIKDKIHKYIPQSSVVGILLETEHNYKVIQSDARNGVLQHNPFNWHVKRGKFKYRKEVNSRSLRLNDYLTGLVSELDDEQIELIGNVIYGVMQSNDITTTEELLKDKKRNVSELIKSVHNIKPEVKEQLWEIIKDVF